MSLFALLSSQAIKKQEELEIQAKEQQAFEIIQSEIKKITPDLFYNESKSKIGHFKQNIQKSLKEIGFVHEGYSMITEFGSGDNYTLYSSDKIALVSVFLRTDNTSLYANFDDEIQGVYITIIDDRLINSFIEEFKSQLTSIGYEVKQYPSTNDYPARPYNSYMLIGNEAHKVNVFGKNTHYFSYNAVAFRGNTIECYAKDELQEDM